MLRNRIVEPRVVGDEILLVLPPEMPPYLAQAVYKVNASGQEMILQLPNGQRAVLSPGTDLDALSALLDSEEFQDAVQEALEENAPSS